MKANPSQITKTSTQKGRMSMLTSITMWTSAPSCRKPRKYPRVPTRGKRPPSTFRRLVNLAEVTMWIAISRIYRRSHLGVGVLSRRLRRKWIATERAWKVRRTPIGSSGTRSSSTFWVASPARPTEGSDRHQKSTLAASCIGISARRHTPSKGNLAQRYYACMDGYLARSRGKPAVN